MASTRVSFTSGVLAIGDEWNRLSAICSSGAQSLRTKMGEIAARAEEIINQTTLTESEGTYTIDGPFASKFTFTWREIIMIGGIVSSVIFAIAAFFAGHAIIGSIFLVYTGLLIFGAYWLSEWTKNLTAKQILEVARAGGDAAIDILKEVIGQFTGVLEGHAEVNAIQINTLQKLYRSLRGAASTVEGAVGRVEGAVGRVEGAVTLLSEEVRAIPRLFEPIIQIMRETLGESRALRDDLREQNEHFRAENDRLQQLIGEQHVQLGMLQGQIQGLQEVLHGFKTEREKLTSTVNGFSQERERLASEINRFAELIPILETKIRGFVEERDRLIITIADLEEKRREILIKIAPQKMD